MKTARHYKSAQLRLKAYFPQIALAFDKLISIDIFYEGSEAVIHSISGHIGLRNASFRTLKHFSDIFSTFDSCLASMYVGFPNNIRSEQEFGEVLDLFRSPAAEHGMEFEYSGVASHNPLGKIEQTHSSRD